MSTPPLKGIAGLHINAFWPALSLCVLVAAAAALQRFIAVRHM